MLSRKRLANSAHAFEEVMSMTRAGLGARS